MSQEIEIEYKILLTFDKYLLLSNKMPFPNQAIMQTNYYFDTKNNDLRKERSALRIRKKNDGYTLTLKEPYGEHILETHDALTEGEFLQWINENPVTKPNVSNQLIKLGIKDTDLIYLGSLTTERKTFTKYGIEYVLDKSEYNGITDYELEIEAPTAESGMAAFKKILQDFHIKKQAAITKNERFFLSLK